MLYARATAQDAVFFSALRENILLYSEMAPDIYSKLDRAIPIGSRPNN
jgi:hypothetical protein